MSKSIIAKQELKVLIIDDNEQITKMIATFLSLSGHQCTVCNDGKESIEVINNNEFNVILLDLAMPDFDGYDVLEKIPEKLRSKIIILTASNLSKINLNKIKNMGVNKILQKPVDIDKLLEKITLTASNK
ncbi:MAG: response regulator [Nitrosopumilaceae archaeon]|nr:response regulator [Nitrosopumilaceae archaeon]NIU01982.1 response regulator [Nitrosopumilaceae archaeon]NIU87133.1 response regulator [Nitrosopumilaceae archaeon]NIV64623.1 response regulator [Nitrosopumilaceae archaeon]NIX62583.1 response regulator [Nitrosopumilaceae archaeon]